MDDLQKLLNIAIEAALKAGEKTLTYFRGDFDILLKDDNSPLTLADLESNKVINDHLSETTIPVMSEENKILPFNTRDDWEQLWLVDPLDGTKEFINRRSDYTINIALIDKNKPILGVVFIPAKSILYYGLKGLGSFKVDVTTKTEINLIKNQSVRIQAENIHKKIVVVASKSHLSDDTKLFIEKLQEIVGECETRSFGSSLKLCMLAEGSADIYPRLGPTMEWDTAASHAIAKFAGCRVISLPEKKPLLYNKEDLLNPWFIVYKKTLDPIVEQII